jgi:hypothetical protein
MQDIKNIWPKLRRFVASAVFLVLSLVQYMAYYVAISSYLTQYVSNLFIVMAIVVTYMFRLDILVASVGFYGLWKVWHAPLWLAAYLTVAFAIVSLLINHWPGTKAQTFLNRLMSKKGKTP